MHVARCNSKDQQENRVRQGLEFSHDMERAEQVEHGERVHPDSSGIRLGSSERERVRVPPGRGEYIS